MKNVWRKERGIKKSILPLRLLTELWIAEPMKPWFNFQVRTATKFRFKMIPCVFFSACCSLQTTPCDWLALDWFKAYSWLGKQQIHAHLGLRLTSHSKTEGSSLNQVTSHWCSSWVFLILSEWADSWLQSHISHCWSTHQKEKKKQKNKT